VVSSAIAFATPFAMLAACVWLPLFPALAWGALRLSRVALR
jgi:hypothetical protein